MMPASVAEAIDWATLAPLPGDFVDAALRERFTDLMFSVRWRDGDEALVYLLFEHQSTCDDLMAFRLVRYLVRIWDHWLSAHSRAKALPMIIPVVLYHRDEQWSAPVTFDALLAVPEALRASIAPHTLRLSYIVDDLSEVPDDQLRKRAMTDLARITQFCFKHARTRADLIDRLASWAEVVRDVARAPNGLEALALMMRYILLVNDHVEPDELQAFLERVAGPEAKETIMTVGERLIQQGEARGLQQGIQQGEKAILLRMLRNRFGNQVDETVERRVEAASPETVVAWADRVISAPALAELLAG